MRDIRKLLLLLGLCASLAAWAQPDFSRLEDVLADARGANTWERYRAMERLGSEASDPRALAALLAGLKDDEPLVRRGAAKGLLGASPSIVIVDHLTAALRDDDPGVRAAVAETLGHCGYQRSLAALQALLRDENAQVRAGAVHGLGRLPWRNRYSPIWGAEIPGNLLGMLGDRDPKVRGAAAWHLGVLKVRPAEPWLIALLDDPIAEVRMRAAEGLGHLRSARAVERLVALLADPDREVARVARHVLSYIDPVAPAVIAATRHANPSVRANAVALLGQRATPEAVAAITAALGDSDMTVRMEAAGALVATHDPAVAPALAPLLRDPSVAVRKIAITTLGSLLLVEERALLHPTLADADAQVQAAACRTLLRLGDATAIETALALLRAGDAATREEAARLLEIPADPRHAPALRAALAEEADDDARIAMINALGVLRDPAAVPALIGLTHSEMLPAAAEALGRIGDRRAVPVLLECLRDNDEDTSLSEVFAALGALGDPRALPALSARAQAFDMEAMTALADLGDAGIPALLKLARHPDPDMRQEAVWRLSNCPHPSTQKALIEIVRTDPVPAVRAAAVRALGHVGDRHVVTVLIPLLAQGDPGVREQAAEVLGWFTDARAVPAVYAAAVDRRAPLSVREAALNTLRDCADLATLERLIPLLHDPHPTISRQTATVLSERRVAKAAPALLEMLRKDTAVTEAAAACAANTPQASAVADLLLARLVAACTPPPPREWQPHPMPFSYEDDPRPALARGLAALGDQRAVPLLRACLNESHDVLLEAAGEALGILQATEAVPALLRNLRSPLISARRGAITALGLLRERRAVPALCLLMRDRFANDAAARALGRIGDPRAIPELIVMLRYGERLNNLQPEALRALAAFDDPRAREALCASADDPHPSDLRDLARKLLGRK